MEKKDDTIYLYQKYIENLEKQLQEVTKTKDRLFALFFFTLIAFGVAISN